MRANLGRLAMTVLAAAGVATAVWVITAPDEPAPRDGRHGPRIVGESRTLLDAAQSDLHGVCVLTSASPSLRGTISFRPQGTGVEISGTIEGLSPGKYRFEVTEFGDGRGIASGSTGDPFLSHDAASRLPKIDFAVEELMSFDVTETRIARLSRINPALTLFGPDSLLGRGFALFSGTTSGSEQTPIAFGVIGRANPAWSPVPVSPLTGHGEGSADRC